MAHLFPCSTPSPKIELRSEDRPASYVRVRPCISEEVWAREKEARASQRAAHKEREREREREKEREG